MTNTPANKPEGEKLRPCPFCGDLPKGRDPFENKAWRCANLRCTPDTKWNEAYCWKQLSALQELNGKLVDMLQQYADRTDISHIAGIMDLLTLSRKERRKNENS